MFSVLPFSVTMLFSLLSFYFLSPLLHIFVIPKPIYWIQTFKQCYFYPSNIFYIKDYHSHTKDHLCCIIWLESSWILYIFPFFIFVFSDRKYLAFSWRLLNKSVYHIVETLFVFFFLHWVTRSSCSCLWKFCTGSGLMFMPFWSVE